jgi:hypothetical protein
MNHLLTIGKPSQLLAIAEGVLVTLILASSFALIKKGLAADTGGATLFSRLSAIAPVHDSQ